MLNLKKLATVVLVALSLGCLGCPPPRPEQKFEVVPMENNIYVFDLVPSNYRPDPELFTVTLNEWLKNNPEIVVIRIEPANASRIRVGKSSYEDYTCKYFVFTKGK